MFVGDDWRVADIAVPPALVVIDVPIVVPFSRSGGFGELILGQASLRWADAIWKNAAICEDALLILCVGGCTSLDEAVIFELSLSSSVGIIESDFPRYLEFFNTDGALTSCV